MAYGRDPSQSSCQRPYRPFCSQPILWQPIDPAVTVLVFERLGCNGASLESLRHGTVSSRDGFIKTLYANLRALSSHLHSQQRLLVRLLSGFCTNQKTFLCTFPSLRTGSVLNEKLGIAVMSIPVETRKKMY